MTSSTGRSPRSEGSERAARARRRDARGTAWTTPDPEAGEALFRAIDGLVSHRADVAACVGEALARDPDLLGAHVLAGFAALLLGRHDLLESARGAHRAASSSLARRGATEREHALVEALGAWCAGDPLRTTEILSRALASEPLDLFALKAHHAVCFYVGRSEAMRAAVEAALPAWRRAGPEGLGAVLGCHAFALTETGEPARAVPIAEQAVRATAERGELDPWGKHALVHALHALGRKDEALAQATGMERDLAGANNFAGHVRWHEAILRVERGELDAALALLDAAIAIYPPRDYRDVVNASTLLFRLEREGVDVGDRWRAVADVAVERTGDHASPFADVHYALSLSGAGRGEALERFVSSMARAAEERDDHAARVAREVGVAVARAVGEAAVAPGRALEVIERLRPELLRLGGSRAQRRIFEWVARAAADAVGGAA